MYKLYSRPGSGSFVIEAALQMAGQQFEQLDIPKSNHLDEAFLKVSPLKQIPVLVLPDGRALPETSAICIFLCERYPQAELAPAPDHPLRLDFLRWMAFMTSAIYPAVLRFYYAERYTTDAGGIVGVKQAAVAELDRCFGIIDTALEERDWLVGDRFSIADVYLLMLFSWHPNAERAKDANPNVETLCAGLRSNPILAKLNIPHEMW